jgi:hypothetical protein
MPDQRESVAKRITPNLVEYVCPRCGWYDLTGVFREFLPFIDHLIRDLALKFHPTLSQPMVQADGVVWFRRPGTSELILGLPPYSPDTSEWDTLLTKNEKLLPQAKVFLIDIASWLEHALIQIEELNDLKQSNIITADRLPRLISRLGDKFMDQRNYLLKYPDALDGVATDPKWTGKTGKQARFVARSYAGARWNLSSSTSREMIRTVNLETRREAMEFLKINSRSVWWDPTAAANLPNTF